MFVYMNYKYNVEYNRLNFILTLIKMRSDNDNDNVMIVFYILDWGLKQSMKWILVITNVSRRQFEGKIIRVDRWNVLSLSN